MSGPSPVLAVEDLTVRFRGQSVDTVDGLDFSIGAGRTLCIVGESGCGKSVTSLAVMRLLPARAASVARGRVRFDGIDLLGLDARAMARLRGNEIAMIFQEPMTSLNPAFRVGDQVVEAVRRHSDRTPGEARAHALELFERVRIPAPGARLDEYPHQLSGGMRQRVMIAMALANAPRLLIADEPTTALDVTLQAQILELVRELQAETGTALLLITHDLGVVAEMADDVAVMYAGRIVERAPASALFADPQHPYTIGLMGSMPALRPRTGRLLTVPGTVPSAERMPPGCRFSTRCPFAIRRCRAEVPPLGAIGAGHAVACHLAPLETLAPAGDTAA